VAENLTENLEEFDFMDVSQMVDICLQDLVVTQKEES
jgi:hypothetical protein